VVENASAARTTLLLLLVRVLPEAQKLRVRA
jgi:hypothetical protein